MTYKELRCLKYTDRMKLDKIDSLDIQGLVTPEFLFNCMELLEKIPNDFKLNNYHRSIEGIFSDCHSLKYIPDLNTDNIVNMNLSFYKCKNLEEIPNINTENVIYMNDIFYGCEKITKVTLDISSLKEGINMFKGCINLRSVKFTNKTTSFNGDIDLNDCPLTYAGILALIKSLPSYKSEDGVDDYDEKLPTIIIYKNEASKKLSLEDITRVYHKGWRIKVEEDIDNEQ